MSKVSVFKVGLISEEPDVTEQSVVCGIIVD